MKKRLISLLLTACMTLSVLPVESFAAETGSRAATGSAVQAHEECGAESAAAWAEGNTAAAVKVTSFTDLVKAVADTKVNDIVLTADGDEDTWMWNSTLSISRDVHITVEQGKTITLKRANKDAELFKVVTKGTLTLGSGTLSTDNEADWQTGNYTISSDPTCGSLIIDGGALWGTGGTDAYFIDENGNRVSKKNNGIYATTALITCPSGTLNIWRNVTLENNHNSQAGNRGSAIWMGNTDRNTAPTLNMYGGVVQWCATSVGENGSGAIYCGYWEDKSDGQWQNYKLTETVDGTEQVVYGKYGTVNIFDGGVLHNANYCSSGYKYGDGTGIAVDAATLNLYGGSVSYNCGDDGLVTSGDQKGAAADGGGIGGRVAAQVNLYGGKVSYNWTGGFGGGVCLWNSQGNLAGTSITNNTARYGGGVAIAGCTDAEPKNDTTDEFSKLTMTGGQIAYNEAVKRGEDTTTGVGGGICAGTSTRPNGSVLDLQGGEITQNKAENGGGVAAYAGRTTALKMSGTAAINGNAAYKEGGGAYFTNHEAGYSNADYLHPLLEMKGEAMIDTANTVYFENVAKAGDKIQVPVQVTGNLNSSGTVAIFEFSNDFWTGTGTNFAHAEADRQIVKFNTGLDIQENKFALDHDAWYLKSDTGTNCLTLQEYADVKQYWIRNGTPVTVDGQKYYRIYDSLASAVNEAADKDTLYIFYNATMKQSAVVDGKHLTLLAESTSSAGDASANSGSGNTSTCWWKDNSFDYRVLTGAFLTQDGNGEEVTASDGKSYKKTDYSYNVRNDYTVTLASGLKLNDGTDPNSKAAAIVVENGGSLDFGQETQMGIGYGSLAFDGNYSYPLNGPMLKVESGGKAVLHSGVTLTKHTNYSTVTPGTVYNEGTFTMMEGSTISGGVSPQAGAVYVAGGTFDMKGGTISGSTGAMPRCTNTNDKLYHGQPKYYYGAGAVYCAAPAAGGTAGVFNMTGGTITGNRGQWGAVAGLGGTLNLTGGTITGNAALKGDGAATGDERYDLTISGYNDGTIPETSGDNLNPGCGGGLYLGGGTANLGAVTITQNWAQQNGGGIAECGGTVSFVAGGGRTNITYNAAGKTNAEPETGSMGGGIYASSAAEINANVNLTNNTAEIGGGLAVVGTDGDTKTSVTVSSDVSSNTAKYGGGVYVGPYAEVAVKHATLSDNTAVYGGGAYVDCVKTLNGKETTELVSPGAVTDEADITPLGTDDKHYGNLILTNAKINNNHLTTDAAGETIGFGSGAYNRGTLTLNEGAYSSANDRLYLEKGHIITLGQSYTGTQQTTANKLTLNSRETALGTNMILMKNSNQFDMLLAAGKEKVAHYSGKPMAKASAVEGLYIELNYYTITYYDRLNADGTLVSHCVEDTVIPGRSYTILGWDAANDLVTTEDRTLKAPDGKSLSGWRAAEMKDGKLQPVEDQKIYTAGTTYEAVGDLILVAEYNANSYTALVDSITKTAEGAEQKSDIGSISLEAEGLTSSPTLSQYYFGKNMEIEIIVEPEEESGHQKGVLTDLTVYEQARVATNGSQPEPDERRYGSYYYKPVASAAFNTVELNGENYVQKGILSGWTPKSDITPSGKFEFKDGKLYYVGGEKSIMVVATFAEPKVELKMTKAAGEGATPENLVEYYDTMYQAFTRMSNLVSAEPTAWASAVITPLKAEDNQVYYYGKANGEEEHTSNTDPKGINVTFNLNGYTLDLQNTPQKELSTYSLTIRNGTVIGNAAAPTESATEPTSQFRVKEGGSLTLSRAVLEVKNATYGVIVEKNGKMSVDQDSQAGKVLLSGDNTYITADDPSTWTELASAASGADYTATIYTNLGALVTPATIEDGKITVESETKTDRQVIAFAASEGRSTIGHNVRSHFLLADSVTDDTYKDEAGYWFISTEGKLNPRIQDAIPQLVCLRHTQEQEGQQIRTEMATDNTNNKEIISSNPQTYYPIYYLYARNYGYNNSATDADGHPLSIVTSLRDAYGNLVEGTRGGIVTVTMAQVVDGVKNRVLTARSDVIDGKSTYTGTDANPVFPAGENSYYLTGSFTGIGEYAPSYARYWKIDDPQRADNNATYISGLSMLKINEKPLDDKSVVITSVTPGSAAYVGEKGAEAGVTSRAGTVRVRDEYTNLNLTSGDDLQNYYRRLTTDSTNNKGIAGEIGDTTYYYADDMYYTATGNWYGPQGDQYTQHVEKIDGQPVGLYSVEVAAIKEGTPKSINYTGVSGWKGQVFEITPYTQHLNTSMKSDIVVPNIGDGATTEQVKEAIKSVIAGNGTDENPGLKITDIYGNSLPINEVTYTFTPADSNAKVDDDGWPCTEGLYSIEIHPYDVGSSDGSKTQDLVGEPEDDPNYSRVAVGYQALLITKEALTMEIQVKNDGEADWNTGALKVPYNGSIYTDSSVKTYDDSGKLKVVEIDEGGVETKLETTQYTLQVGLPKDPARDAGVHVLVATDYSGEYVAIGNIEIIQNDLEKVTVTPGSTVYTGKRIDPTITVTDTAGNTLVEGRDYSVSMTADGNVATGIILNAGEYTITVSGKGNYTGTAKTYFTVEPKDITLGATDNEIPVNISVPEYNLGEGSTRPRAVLSYNGLMMSPGTDYAQKFIKNGADVEENENFPDKIEFTGNGNYTGTRTITVTTVELPKDKDLTITDSENSYVYQATDLFGYLTFDTLTITEVSREEANRDVDNFDNYTVEIASVEDYAKDNEHTTYQGATDVILDVGSYIVKMTRNRDSMVGYFFVRIAPRPVTITVKEQTKVYGEAKPEYPYTTDLVTTVGSTRDVPQRGEIDYDKGFFVHDVEKDRVDGELYRAEGEDVGAYYYALNTFTAGDNYTLTINTDHQFYITPKSLAKETPGTGLGFDPAQVADGITINCDETEEYTGYPVFPLNSVTYDSVLLKKLSLAENADYTLSYYKRKDSPSGTAEGVAGEEAEDPNWTALPSAPTDVGEYKIRITGIGNYMNYVEKEFEILPAGKELKVTLSESTVTYKADAYHPNVTVKTSGNSLLSDSNYSLSYIFTPRGGVAGSSKPYDATTTFTEAGTYRIAANGTGNYHQAYGYAVFTIEPKSLVEDNKDNGTQAVAVKDIDDRTYTGEAITFADGLEDVTYAGLEDGGLTGDRVAKLEYGTDYDLTYLYNTDAGTAIVALHGKGNYTGSRDVEFKIQPQTVYVEVSGAKKTYGESDPEYTFKVYADADGKTELTGVNITGKPARAEGENAGEYALHTGEGSTLSAGTNYAIELKDSPKLVIEKKAIGNDDQNPAERIVASISYVEATEGATWPEPVVTYWSSAMTAEILTKDKYTVTYFKKDGTEVSADAPITQDSIGEYYAIVTAADGTNYSNSVKLDFMIVKEGSHLALTATGSGVYTPDGGVAELTTLYGKDDVTTNPNTKYTVTCYAMDGTSNSNITVTDGKFNTSDAGTYVIQAQYQTTIDGTPSAAFGSATVVITPKPITDASVNVPTIPEQNYTGNAITPKLNITDGGKTLEEQKDYTVSYSNNVQPDSAASVTITGMGNYTGTKTVEFKIGPMQYTLKYDANGGNLPVPEEKRSQTTFPVASGDQMTHANDKVDGKDVTVLFIGWSESSDGGKIYAKSDTLPTNILTGGQTLTPTQPVTTLYAIWGYDTDGNKVPDVTQGKYRVDYQKGISDGNAPIDGTIYLFGQTATAMNPTGLSYKNGEYVFMGWTPTILADDQQSRYAADSLSDYLSLGNIYPKDSQFLVYSNTGDANQCVLYPVWGKDEDGNGVADFMEGNVLLIYNGNGGNGVPPTQECQAGENTTISDKQPVRSGAVFLGWTEEPQELQTSAPSDELKIYEGGSPYPVPDPTPIKYVTLYALWAADENNNGKADYLDTKYAVTYDLNDGTGSATDSNTYLEGQTIPLHSGTDLTKTGHTFAGWSLTKDGDKIAGNSYTIPDGEDNAETTVTLTFYAVWEEKGHTVTVTVVGTGGTATVKNGSDTAGQNSTTVLDGGSATVTFTPNAGYSLGGVIVNGEDKTATVANNTLKLTNITKDTSVVVTFQSNAFRVAALKNSEYTGSGQEPKLTVKSGDATLTQDTDYKVTYAAVDGTGAKLDDNEEPLTAGTYTVTVVGQDNYKGNSAATTFVITPKALTEGMVAVTENAEGTALNVSVVDGDKTLTEGADYTVSYDGNVTPGQNVTVTVTGIGNYKGKVDKTVTISGASQWTLTYMNGNEKIEEQKHTKGATVTVLGQGNLTKEDYVFSGWSKSKTATAADYKAGDTFQITEDTTLYAVWTAEVKVKVTYWLSADKTETSDEVKTGEKVTLRNTDGLTKKGYTFLGWIMQNTERVIDEQKEIALEGRVYQPGETINLYENMTLSPLWINNALRDKLCLVVYRPNGGDDREISTTAFLVLKDGKYTIIAEEPTREGYSFLGWTMERTPPSQTRETTTYYHKDEYVDINGAEVITFYAQWEKNASYTVTYDGNGHTGGTEPKDSNLYAKNEEATIQGKDDLARAGATFLGWSTTEHKLVETKEVHDAIRSTILEEASTLTITSNTTLYAVWAVDSNGNGEPDYNEEKKSLTFKWVDNNDQDGKRPTELSVTLANGNILKVNSSKVTISADGNTWTTVAEYLSTVAADGVKVENYDVKIDENGTTVTLTYTPGTTSITATKVWENMENVPDTWSNITAEFVLYGNGKLVQDAEGNAIKQTAVYDDEESTTTVTWTGLDKYENGQEIVYHAYETGVTAGVKSADETSEPDDSSLESTETTESAASVTKVTDRFQTTYDLGNNEITNKFLADTEAQKRAFTFVQEWDDSNNAAGMRPTSITVKLVDQDGNVIKDNVEITAGDNWSHTWYDLDTYVSTDGDYAEYYVERTGIKYDKEGFNDLYKQSGSVRLGGEEYYANVQIDTLKINPDMFNRTLTIEKKWVGDEKVKNNRPASVAIQLLANDKVVQTVVLSGENDWTKEVTVPKYRNFEEIEYRVEEVEPSSKYDVSYDQGENVTGTFTVTNTLNEDISNKDHTITFVYEHAYATDGEGKAIAENVAITVPAGESYTFTAHANEGYHLEGGAQIDKANAAEMRIVSGNTYQVSNLTDDVTVTITAKKTSTGANLSVTKTANKATATPGETITWTIVVKNTGDAALSGITVTDQMTGATGTTLTLANGDKLEPSNGVYTITPGVDLAADKKITYTVSYVVQDGDAGKTIQNTAIAQAGNMKAQDDATVSVKEKTDSTPPADQVKLTYVYNDGRTENKVVTYDKGTEVTLEMPPAREGYTFLGWYTDKALTQGPITTIVMDTDKTVYAKWEQAHPELNKQDHVAYIIGYPNSTNVQPEASITRAEVATIFFRLLTDESRAQYWSKTNPYPDVNANDWFNNAISTLTNAGILQGDDTKSFRPLDPITRAEFCAIAARFDDVTKLTGTTTSFKDVTSDHWAIKYIAHAVEEGWVIGVGDNQFEPNRAITRAEAMKITNRVLERAVEHDTDLHKDMITWTDNTPDKWYYLDVQEATNSHGYDRTSSYVTGTDADGKVTYQFHYEKWKSIEKVPDWAKLERSWSDANDVQAWTH